MIHGHSIIELTDVNTGETERFEDDNIVTNGLKYYISAIRGSSKIGSGGNEWKTLFGGIKLMDSPLEESVETIYVPLDVGLVGYAGLDADTTDPKRGLFNEAESGILEDWSGVKLVWDFAQNQANGSIECIGLTPTKYVTGAKVKKEVSQEKSMRFYDKSYRFIDYNRIERCIYTREVIKSDNIIKIRKLSYPIWDHGITDGALEQVREEISISVDGMSECKSSILYSGMDDQYYYFHGVKSYDRSQEPYKTVFKLIKLRKKTFECESSEFIFSESAYPKVYWDINAYSASVIKGGDFYIYAPSEKKYFRVELINFSVVNVIDMTKTKIYQDNTPLLRGEEILFDDFSIDKNDEVHFDRTGYHFSTYGITTNNGHCIFINASGPNMLIYSYSLLFTVNNLSTPVTKTADKSMKITYILKEDTGTT